MDRDYHIGDFGNLPIIEGIVVDEEIVVQPEIAGLFEESDNQVNFFVITCDVLIYIA